MSLVGETIDLVELRNRLAGTIDELLADQIRDHAWQVVRWLGAATAVAALLIAWGVRQIPAFW